MRCSRLSLGRVVNEKPKIVELNDKLCRECFLRLVCEFAHVNDTVGKEYLNISHCVYGPAKVTTMVDQRIRHTAAAWV
jgi:hypothetical protein